MVKDALQALSHIISPKSRWGLTKALYTVIKAGLGRTFFNFSNKSPMVLLIFDAIIFDFVEKTDYYSQKQLLSDY